VLIGYLSATLSGLAPYSLFGGSDMKFRTPKIDPASGSFLRKKPSRKSIKAGNLGLIFSFRNV
jgi:hypothetical protein